MGVGGWGGGVCGVMYYITCLFQKKQLFEQSHSMNMFTENRDLFFEENWNSKVNTV